MRPSFCGLLEGSLSCNATPTAGLSASMHHFSLAWDSALGKECSKSGKSLTGEDGRMQSAATSPVNRKLLMAKLPFGSLKLRLPKCCHWANHWKAYQEKEPNMQKQVVASWFMVVVIGFDVISMQVKENAGVKCW